jgi:CheY-like chemotaxis protein
MSALAGSSRVLVIEEHPFQRRALARRLNELGVPRVLEAAGSSEALEHVRASAGSIALILSSLDVPQMDGLELLRALGAEAPQIAVAVLSALDRAPLRMIEAGAAEYGLRLVGLLEKPVSDDALRAVLVRAFQAGGSRASTRTIMRSQRSAPNS